MRICVIGLASSGKTTVFRALTGGGENPLDPQAAQIRAVQVPDERVDRLSALYKPKKTTYASIEYVDLGSQAALKPGSGELGARFLAEVRTAAVLIHVIDGFSMDDIDRAVSQAVDGIDTELTLADLTVAEKRLTRLRKEGAKSGPGAEEAQLLEQAMEYLAAGTPLRLHPELAQTGPMRGFLFLSAKPVITVVNTAEDRPHWTPENLPASIRQAREGECGRFIPLCGRLEAEIASLATADASAFLADYGIAQPARERVLRLSYDLLGLMSFFTVGEDEVRAWTIRKGTVARDAAAVIHSDIARGFIRAEVVDYPTASALGGFEAAKKRGKIRLEGKEYPMQDGDIVNYRFAV